MKTDLEERLKLEAQIQAQEARSHRATVREIYQAITGRTGEPGDWNGAKPVLALIEERDRLRARVDALTGLLSQRDDLIQDNRERIQELKSRMAELEGFILAARTAFNTNDLLGLQTALFAAPVKG